MTQPLRCFFYAMKLIKNHETNWKSNKNTINPRPSEEKYVRFYSSRGIKFYIYKFRYLLCHWSPPPMLVSGSFTVHNVTVVDLFWLNAFCHKMNYTKELKHTQDSYPYNNGRESKIICPLINYSRICCYSGTSTVWEKKRMSAGDNVHLYKV